MDRELLERLDKLVDNTAPIIAVNAEDIYLYLIDQDVPQDEALRQAEAVPNETLQLMSDDMFDYLFSSDQFRDALQDAMERHGLIVQQLAQLDKEIQST